MSRNRIRAGGRNGFGSKPIVGALLCATLWALIAWYIPKAGPSEADDAFRRWMDALRSDGATTIWKPAAWLGETTAIIVLTLVLTAFAAWRTGAARAIWILAGVAAAYGINTLLKTLIDRPRPDYAWGIEADGSSFPSGNAMIAVVLYGLTAAWLIKYGRIGSGARFAAIAAAVALIVLFGMSRLYFGVHYLTDIVGGYAAGGAVLLAVLALSPAKKA